MLTIQEEPIIILNVLSGDYCIEETLLSIPNRTVKLYSADGTAWGTVWESKTLPGPIGSLAQLVRATGS